MSIREQLKDAVQYAYSHTFDGLSLSKENMQQGQAKALTGIMRYESSLKILEKEIKSLEELLEDLKKANDNGEIKKAHELNEEIRKRMNDLINAND